MCNCFSRVYFQIGLLLDATNYVYCTSCLDVNKGLSDRFQKEQR